MASRPPDYELSRRVCRPAAKPTIITVAQLCDRVWAQRIHPPSTVLPTRTGLCFCSIELSVPLLPDPQIGRVGARTRRRIGRQSLRANDAALGVRAKAAHCGG